MSGMAASSVSSMLWPHSHPWSPWRILKSLYLPILAHSSQAPQRPACPVGPQSSFVWRWRTGRTDGEECRGRYECWMSVFSSRSVWKDAEGVQTSDQAKSCLLSKKHVVVQWGEVCVVFIALWSWMDRNSLLYVLWGVLCPRVATSLFDPFFGCCLFQSLICGSH